ncbi:MAG: hypothetical protein IOD05_07390 [Rhodobacter sp.]|nr:hypothetical protein [Rhodobacter sp.]
MSDNITLPREVVERARKALTPMAYHTPPYERSEIANAFRDALAAPCLEVTVDPRLTPDEAAAISSALAAPKQEPVAYFDLQKQVFFWAKPTMIDVPMTVALKPLPLYAALAAPRPEPVFDGQSGHPVMLPRAPEPVLGLISDEVRAALKAADAVESQEAYRTRTPAAAPEPVRHPGYVIGSHWLETAYERICAGEAEADVLRDCSWERVTDAEALRRDAERYRWLRGEHSRIDPCIKANAKYKLERQSSTWVNIHDLDAAIDAAMKEGT